MKIQYKNKLKGSNRNECWIMRCDEDRWEFSTTNRAQNHGGGMFFGRKKIQKIKLKPKAKNGVFVCACPSRIRTMIARAPDQPKFVCYEMRGGAQRGKKVIR